MLMVVTDKDINTGGDFVYIGDAVCHPLISNVTTLRSTI